ncbi:hypothetical protein [Desulfurococcus amylolyticus]|nr:hypothetical protein [Desulfurococcus amylolyticus]
MKRVLAAMALILALIAGLTTLHAGVFSYRIMSNSVVVQPLNLVSITYPPQNLTCTGLSKIISGFYYQESFESIPLNWVVINATPTPKGFIGPGGYWSIVDGGYAGKAIRGYPLLWQVREHKTYTIYNPDTRFLPQTSNAIRIDSYQAGNTPIGNGYLLLIAPIELLNNTVVGTRLDVYFSWNRRTVGYIDLVNATIDRRDDAVIFSTYNDVPPYWRKYGTPSYIGIAEIYKARGGTTSYNFNSTLLQLQGYGPYMTYAITMTDYWNRQTLYFDVYWIALYDSTGSLIYNFTFPYGKYSVVMERSGTTGDYGYLNFGFPGFTAMYYNRDISSYAVYTGVQVSTLLNIRGGVGWGSVILTDRVNNYYAFALNTSGYLNILRNAGTGWSVLKSALVPGYTNSTWYKLTVTYSRVGTTNYFSVYLYDVSGNLVTQLSASDDFFQPVFAGLGSYTSNLLYVDVLYDNFIIGQPAITLINAPGANYVGELWSLSDVLVSSGVSDASGIIRLPVDPATTMNGGVFKVYYPNNVACLATQYPSTEVIRAGDVYNVLWKPIYLDPSLLNVMFYIGYGANTTYAPIFNVSIYSGYSAYAYLLLDTSASVIDPGLSINILLINSSGAVSGKIIISSGAVLSSQTSPSILVAGSSSYVYIEGGYSAPRSSSSLMIYMVACGSPTLAACIYIPVQLVVMSPDT